ncbi:Transcriptional regulator [Mesorhizobium loti]|nr:Transcriptional regulator [Mesorhizobium loti]
MEVTAEAAGAFVAALFPIKGRLPRVPQTHSMAASFETYIRKGCIEPNILPTEVA